MVKKIMVLLASVTSLVMGAILTNNNTSFYESKGFSFVELDDEYRLNESIIIPGALIEIDSQTFKAKHILTYPSGKKTYENSIVLNEVGVYKLEYYYIHNNLYYSKTESFKVVSSFFDIGNTSSAYYGVPEESGTKGLVVELAPNEELVFNQGLEADSITSLNTFIEAYVAPYTRGVGDFSSLVFTLFNPLNPEEYLRFKLNEIPSENLYPALATVNMRGNGTDTIGDDSGDKRLIHRNDGQGTKTLVSFKGRTASYVTEDGKNTEQVPCLTAPYDTTKLRLVVDYPSRSAYTYNPWFSNDGTISSPDGNGKIIIGDLDNSDYVNNKIWSGFSSDYVKLKVSAEKFSGTKARFVLSKINGIDLAAEALDDINAPKITIDSPFSVLPTGVIGCNYPIFKAHAIDDIDGNVAVNVSVWKDYGKASASNLEINDWHFTPLNNGEYTIVYEAFDNAGNRTEEDLNIVVSDNVDPINISVNESEKVTSTFMGVSLVLPSANYSGGSGSLKLEISASLNGYKEIINADRKFTPTQSGEWTITYTVTDFIGVKKELSYQVLVSKSDKAILTEEFFGDEYIIAYSDYVIPTPQIIKYIGDEKNEPNFDVLVTVDGVTSNYHKGDCVYFGNVLNGTKAKFEYYYDSTLLTSFEANVINPFTLNEYQATQLAIENYFISDNANVVFEEPGVDTPSYEVGAKIISTGNSVTSVRYANYVLSELFRCSFTTFKNNSNFDSIDLVITDSINKNNSVVVNLSRENDAYFASVNGQEKKFIMDESNKSYDEFSISYHNKKLTICNVTFDVLTNRQGLNFAGFTSRKVSFEMEISGLANSSYVILNSINNQNIIKTSRNLIDYIAPEIDVYDDINGTYGLNEVISTPLAISQDALSQNTKLTVSVYIKDTYEPVKDVNGNEITDLPANVSYDFVLSELTEYVITYTATEEYNGQKYWQRRNTATESTTIICLDKESPVIKFTSFFPQTCKVNDVVALPTFTVIDNSNFEIITKRYMILPNGLSTEIDDKAKSYKFVEKGTYEYRVVSIDFSHNISVNSLYITVI